MATPDTDALPALLADGFHACNASVHARYAALLAWCLRWRIDPPPRDLAQLLAGRDHGGDWDELARRLRRDARNQPPRREKNV